jgi:hypothetical protein
MTAKIPLVPSHCQCQLVFQMVNSDQNKESSDAIDRFLRCLNPSEVERHGMHDGSWSKMVEQGER